MAFIDSNDYLEICVHSTKTHAINKNPKMKYTTKTCINKKIKFAREKNKLH